MMRVARTQKSAVAEEFGAALSELQMGKSRNEALEDLARRNNNSDLRKFVTALQQVDRLGVPISTVLAEQSHEMRLIRQQRAREQAQKVPIKILMPVMFCFLPGIFIIILGPAVLSIVKGLAFAG
jgi:tight adherence protein C